ncbi:hypothetical protein J2Z83_003897 [Virgibacillus natechei]|uniref:Uncharacterized protein n=1 Tax=Virgibacillus natechei TaxID=1216297 RepID=A0ABS4ILB4_9BACI|nr:hypothetical protein [Virgibacillus natechei]MBP1971742.1 hypothetical protein [Virgibacillus natechei]UZD12346.1 hypothetical protein OLD84_15725 [Virgibacillus natechei]
MTDKQKAIKNVMDFLRDKNKKLLLVRGYDNDAKVRVVISCLNKEFDKGIIRTSSMSDISDHINRAFGKNLLTNTVKSTTNYSLGKMTVNINSYVTHTAANPRGNESTFALFYPVQLVLDNPKRYNNFLNHLNNSKSSKIILITTNEWSIREWDIENYVDEVFFYSVENDNPEIMSNLRNNGAIL